MAGFYEWQKTPAGKIPHFICPLNGELFNVAGHYERWRPKDGEPVETFTIVTTEANEAVAKLHDRMLVNLDEQGAAAWVDPANEDSERLKSLLQPCPADEIRAYPVSNRVSNSKNEGPDLIEPTDS